MANRQVKYKKAPQAPRRFKSSYMFFSTEKHKEIRMDQTQTDGCGAKKVGSSIVQLAMFLA
jgi:hypothetical protein